MVLLEAFAFAEACTPVLTPCAYSCFSIALPLPIAFGGHHDSKKSCCTLGKHSESRNKSRNKLQIKFSILFKEVFISDFSFV